jgi:hypothetical protein
MMQEYKNTKDEDCILIEYADGSTWSGLKSAYDEMMANEAASL